MDPRRRQRGWSLRNCRTPPSGGDLGGNNLFEITIKNVKDFSLWLHPQVVDFSKPITVNLNGNSPTRTAKPTLLDALRSYQRRRDWGIVYHGELKITVQ